MQIKLENENVFDCFKEHGYLHAFLVYNNLQHYTRDELFHHDKTTGIKVSKLDFEFCKRITDRFEIHSEEFTNLLTTVLQIFKAVTNYEKQTNSGYLMHQASLIINESKSILAYNNLVFSSFRHVKEMNENVKLNFSVMINGKWEKLKLTHKDIFIDALNSIVEFSEHQANNLLQSYNEVGKDFYNEMKAYKSDKGKNELHQNVRLSKRLSKSFMQVINLQTIPTEEKDKRIILGYLLAKVGLLESEKEFAITSNLRNYKDAKRESYTQYENYLYDNVGNFIK